MVAERELAFGTREGVLQCHADNIERHRGQLDYTYAAEQFFSQEYDGGYGLLCTAHNGRRAAHILSLRVSGVGQPEKFNSFT